MFSSRRMRAILLSAAAAALTAIGTSASATVTVVDNYYGGLNTYNGADVIGDTAVFDTKDVKFDRTNGGNTLHIVIDTNYAGAPGTAGADGTGYGAFFITPGVNAWQPVGPAPYVNDVYQPGEWEYAVALPTVGAGGNADLYAVGSATGASYGPDGTTVATYTTTNGAVVMSNVNGDPITYPNPGNPAYYFRQGQAVQFTPDQSAAPVALGSWSVLPGQLVLDINDNGTLGNAFAFSWAMTCGNDVIQGQAPGVPEPATWAMLLMGFVGLGAMLRFRRRGALAA